MRSEIDLGIGLLGPLRVEVDGQEISAPVGKQAVILACLAMWPGQPVTIGVLAHKAWGEKRPENVRSSLHTLVARLRRAVPGCRISWRQSGYCLDIHPERIDLHRFRNLVSDAEALAADNSDQARGLLEQALDLWRGGALAGLGSDTFERDDCLRLEEERLAALTLRIRLDLAAARYARIVPELRLLTEKYPLHETLWLLRMQALYGSGQVAAALDCYTTARTTFVRELGIQPTARLQELHRAILRDDPRLRNSYRAGPAAPDSGEPECFSGRCANSLPAGLGDFTGREYELATIIQAAGEKNGSYSGLRVVTIDGMPGIGKTALAVEAAHRCTAQYPDAQIFFDLRGHCASAGAVNSFDALGALLRIMGVSRRQVPDTLVERASLWRMCVADQKILLVLDDAVDAAQVRPLLPGAANCMVLITSRHRIADLEPADQCLSLEVLPECEASTLLMRIAGPQRTALDAAAKVSRLCGALPLALRITGQRLLMRPAWSMAYMALRLCDEDTRLDELATGSRSLASEFDASYERLDQRSKYLFRVLGRTDKDRFTAADVATLSGMPSRIAESILEVLVNAHLLEQHSLGRYELHDLLRIYASNIAQREAAADSASPFISISMLLAGREPVWGAGPGTPSPSGRICGN